MTDNRNLLKLIPEQREELQRWAQSRTLPAGDVFRARLILALADGTPYREIARRLNTSLPTIARWKMRFERDGLAGLEGRHQGSKPRAATPKVQARVIRRVQQKPEDGSTHWSCRKLAHELGLSKSTVQRILAQAQLKPHRLERYMASNDPDFESKAADILGLYLHPPQHAAVCFASMKRRPFRLWIGSTRCYRCRRGERNGMASNTTATARFRSMRPSM